MSVHLSDGAHAFVIQRIHFVCKWYQKTAATAASQLLPELQNHSDQFQFPAFQLDLLKHNWRAASRRSPACESEHAMQR
jgi:hypothetical protein